MNTALKLIAQPIFKFIKTESSSGIILIICAAFAMFVANSPYSSSYFDLLEKKFFHLSVLHWINDALMAIFFFVVGLEIKRELVVGELKTLKKATLPILSALGGMLVPALFYWTLNKNGSGANGWAIPMATDIAFALGVLSLFGSRVPINLKIFLLAIAIVDDIGAVLVIAFFYTEQIKSLGLLIAFGAFLAVFASQHLKFKNYLIYVGIGAIAWYGILSSGVHATIAGVILGMITPYSFPVNKAGDTFSPVDNLIHYLHPVVGFFIMPVFALSNAGVNLGETNLAEIFANDVSLGIILGLVFGKPIGIFIFSFIPVKLGFSKLPDQINWTGLLSLSCLAGIGFTMSIFISNLSLSTGDIVFAKVGIIVASLISASLGVIALSIKLRSLAQR